MNHILVILALLGSTLGFSQKESLRQIHYSSMTRGISESLIVTGDSVKFSVENRIKKSKSNSTRLTTSKEWKLLISLINSIDLAKIESLASPTNKRQYDGARHSGITIITNLGSYGHRFDDEEPHELLMDLMKCLLTIKKRKL